MAKSRVVIVVSLVGLLFLATAGSAVTAANGEFDRDICTRSGEIVAEGSTGVAHSLVRSICV